VATDTRLEAICRCFDHIFFETYRTRLTGGHSEPFYKAPSTSHDGEIQFTRDFFRSALHETAHWCVAGDERLSKNDWGYWYSPDGRNAEQQQAFFKMEIKPQALEWIFCDACREPFSISADNLNGSTEGQSDFEKEVLAQKESYLQHGLPDRAAKWVQGLSSTFSEAKSSPLATL
jgi:elongation factor P hydroxylase